jgi:AcrR family transcriptional regulator
VPRKYELRARAEQQEDTRRRIVDATFRLHASIGPARTTIAQIADTAGVERLTVYRHFPEMAMLSQACAAHGLTLYPLPRPAEWGTTGDREARLRLGLAQTYAYYRRNEQMMGVILGDREAGYAVGDRFVAYMADAAAALAADLPAVPLVRAAVGHAVDFSAWRSLSRLGLPDGQIAGLMIVMIRAAAGDGRG